MTIDPNISLVDRVLARVAYEHGCWIYQGGLDRTGYGRITIAQRDANGGRHRTAAAHRIVYEACVGPLGDMTVDHLCRNRACCNPLDMEAVPFAVNLLRGTSPAARHAKKTRCPKGHEYDRVRLSDGGRLCSTCIKFHNDNHYRKHKAAVAARSLQSF